jgi:hypothetical protein
MIDKDFPVPTGLSLIEGVDDLSSALEKMLVESQLCALAETGLFINLKSSLNFSAVWNFVCTFNALQSVAHLALVWVCNFLTTCHFFII